MPQSPEICPHCGAEVPPRARACPECGSTEETGWSDDATASRLGIPTDDFDYDNFVQEEFGSKRNQRTGLKWYWVATAAGLLILFAYAFFKTFN